ncbi:MAG: hypothetical protein Q7T89_10810, partial [Anaerolineales bacterium]|nr:hypothetical protein [Anaerolineales bacterium]
IGSRLFEAPDFAMSFDWALHCSQTLEFVFRSSADETAKYKIYFHNGGAGQLLLQEKVLQEFKYSPVSGSEFCYDRDREDRWSEVTLNNFLIIVYGENLAIFANGDFVLEFNELTLPGEAVFLRSKGGAISKGDNFKFWNFSGMDFTQ